MAVEAYKWPIWYFGIGNKIKCSFCKPFETLFKILAIGYFPFHERVCFTTFSIVSNLKSLKESIDPLFKCLQKTHIELITEILFNSTRFSQKPFRTCKFLYTPKHRTCLSNIQGRKWKETDFLQNIKWIWAPRYRPDVRISQYYLFCETRTPGLYRGAHIQISYWQFEASWNVQLIFFILLFLAW